MANNSVDSEPLHKETVTASTPSICANVDMQYCVSRRKGHQSTRRKVNLAPNHWRRYLPPSWGIQRKTAQPWGSFWSTVLVKEISKHRRPATYCQCLRLLATSSSSALIDLVLLMSTYLKINQHVRSRQLRPSMTLLHFVQQYTKPRVSNTEPPRKVVVIVGLTWSQVWAVLSAESHASCPFRHQSERTVSHTTFAAVYADFLLSGSIPSSLEDDIHRLQQLSQQPSEDDDTEVSLKYLALL